jgi:type I site-specific restriction endonuclease
VSTPTEARTRKELIDPALAKAGWDVNNPDQVGIEIPVDRFDPQAWKVLEAKLRRLRETGVVYDAKLPKGISDYVLYRPNGETMAVVEAKRTSIDPRLAASVSPFPHRKHCPCMQQTCCSFCTRKGIQHRLLASRSILAKFNFT